MRARRRLALILLIGAPVAACGGGDDPAADDPARPNVVVLMTDDQTIESMRVMPGVRRALAAEGTTFTRSFTSFAVCCPSRATFLTGQYAHNHGVLSNRPPEGGYRRLDRYETLPVWLGRAGYRTMHVGKFLNRYGQHLGPHHVPPGWDEWHGSIDPSTYRYYGYTLNENGTLVTYPRAYSTDLYADRAIELIEDAAAAGEPFFLNVGFLAPHAGAPRDADDLRGLATPSPAPRHRDRFAREPLPGERACGLRRGRHERQAGLSARCAAIDARRAAVIRENYRQRLEALLAVDEAVVDDRRRRCARQGELDDTLVIFTSDNGFFHGEHRMPSEKMLVYEPSIRVPLDHARAGGAEGRAARPARDQRRSLAHDPRGRRGQRRQAAGRPLPSPPARRPGARVGPRPADRGHGRLHDRRLRGAADLPLPLRPLHHRGARALRPRARSRTS